MNKWVIGCIGLVGTIIITVLCVVFVFGINLLTGIEIDSPSPQVTTDQTPTRQPAPLPTSLPIAAPWYTVYFTNPQYPDRPEYHKNGIDEKLVALIDSATRTVDLAIYDFDLKNVAGALARAVQRGVRVRIVTDTDTLESENPDIVAVLNILKQARILITSDERGPIMHHKFVVVDNREIWTGSWNFTDGDSYRLNNNAIRITSPALAANYTAEFEKMYIAETFGPTKVAGAPNPLLMINGVRVENYFSPKDKISTRIIPRINGAQSSIYFMAYSFTHDGIGNAMINRFKSGVKVAGVFENTGSQTPYSEYTRMQGAGIEVYRDGNPYIMHHKIIIIDERTVIFGSYNFSENAESANDENILIIDDTNLARAFKAEYDRIVRVAQNPPAR